MTSEGQAVIVIEQDSHKFDPKIKQKAVYKWYDSRYSDEALDIYSTEWQQRIITWHQSAVDKTATALSSEEFLEELDFGSFFLAHPIAAFSLWQVLQACYTLDRAVCGITAADLDEITAWQKLAPFKYLRDPEVQLKWRGSLELLKEGIKTQGQDLKEPWELRMYGILLGVERFEDSFAALKENFEVNLVGMQSAKWMVDRIDEDIGKRFSMIIDLLEFEEHELENIRAAESNDSEPALNSTPQYPATSTRAMTESHYGNKQIFETSPTPKAKPKSIKSILNLKTGLNVIKARYHRHKRFFQVTQRQH